MIIRNKKRALATCVAIVIGIFLSASIGIASRASTLQNNAIVEADSILTYTLNARYDSVDKFATETSSSAALNPNIKSDKFVVEDSLPYNLVTSDDLLENADVSFSSDSCATTYSSSFDEGVVRFAFDTMPSGCEVSITFAVRTPDTTDNMHFNNTAYINSGNQILASNTVHDSIGTTGQTYTVSYGVGGDLPDMIYARSLLPENAVYEYGASVALKTTGMDLPGHRFIGWYIEDELVYGDKFYVEGDTAVVAKWEAVNEFYIVDYEIAAGSSAPANYQLPSSNSYEAFSLVKFEVPTVGDIIDGYRFLGVTVSDTDNCELINTTNPSCVIKDDVTASLSFEQVTYNLSYVFTGDIPADAVLPAAQNIAPGTPVTLASVAPVEDYDFIGWNYDSQFTMPEEDLVIRGGWRDASGYGDFRPVITAMNSNAKSFFILGEKIEYRVTVINTAEYDINNVEVVSWLSGNEFLAGNGYEIQSDQHVSIPTIPAGQSVDAIAQVQVTSAMNYTHSITNNFEIIYADSEFGEYDYHMDYSSATVEAQIKNTRELPSTGVASGNKTIIIFGALALVAVSAICFILINRFRVRLNYAKLGLGVFAIGAITLGALVLNGSLSASALGGGSNTISNDEQGWTLERSIRWTNSQQNAMRVNYTLNTEEKYFDEESKTIIYLIDSSISGEADYFNNIAQEIENNYEKDIEEGKENHYAVIMYNDRAGVVSGYADAVDTTNIVDPCEDNCGEFFTEVDRTSALELVGTLLANNEVSRDEEIVLVMISDERSTENRAGEAMARNSLVSNYENLTINAINVNTGTLNVHGSIADNSYYAKDTDLSSAMRHAVNKIKHYSSFVIYDFFNEEKISNAEIESVSDGDAVVIDGNIVEWDLGALETGKTATMSVILTNGTLGEVYGASDIIKAYTDLGDGEEYTDAENALDTYQEVNINYDLNLPSSCSVEQETYSEVHTVSEEDIDLTSPAASVLRTCDWRFVGWGVVDEDVEMTDFDTIKQLPGHNITVRAVWDKFTLTKSAAGTEVTP